MAYKAGDSEKLVTADVVTIATTSGSPWAVEKGMTVSSPLVNADRFFALPDPTAVPSGMRFEIKDGSGNSETYPITISAPATVEIDGSTDPDTINRNYGGKTFVAAGSSYVIAGDVREVIAPAPAGGSYSETFGGSDGDPIPSGWTQAQTGGWLNGNGVWSISGDMWDASGGNTTSVIAEGEGGALGTTSYNIHDATTTGNTCSSTLTYDAGTLAAGTVVSFQWTKDIVYGNYHNFTFKVNGSLEKSCPNALGWHAETYTIPTTAPYIFEFEWSPQTYAAGNSYNYYSARQEPSRHSSCFIDTFVIS